MKTFTVFVMLCIGTTATLFAQDRFRVEVLKTVRSDFGLSYNFFTGEDSDDFRTTINGFGSGFILDLFSGRFSIDYVNIGTDRANLSLGAGFAVSKYRFSENIVFENTENAFGYVIDDDPTRDYGTGFFSYGKSKLVIGTLILPVHLNIHVGEFMISAGGTADFYVFGKHKRKFEENGDRQKVVIRNDDFNDFPINKTKFGLSGMIRHNPTGLNLGITYMMTPFFEDEAGIDLNEVRISASYQIAFRDY